MGTIKYKITIKYKKMNISINDSTIDQALINESIDHEYPQEDQNVEYIDIEENGGNLEEDLVEDLERATNKATWTTTRKVWAGASGTLFALTCYTFINFILVFSSYDCHGGNYDNEDATQEDARSTRCEGATTLRIAMFGVS